MGAGRKPKWDELNMSDRLPEIEDMARQGMTNKEISDALGINQTTFYKWKKEQPDFVAALEKGKGVADIRVENSAYRAAIGYYTEEDQVTNSGKVVRVRKWHPPNPTLAIFWLKNRMPKKWRDKIDLGHEGKVDHEIEVSWGGPMIDDEGSSDGEG